MYRYKAKVVGVLGEDEIVAEIDLGFGVFVRERFSLLGLRGRPIDAKPQINDFREWMEKSLIGQTFVLESHKRSRAQYVAVLFGVENVNCRHTWAESLNAGIAERWSTPEPPSEAT